ncbi:MAG: polysaccharide export protein, partial [Muribaculaceae bacterium]|nr:polysaccharide export protein [Muribaculaceae bacterium]
NSVLVIREQGGKKSYQNMNLADSNIFSSPYFYLQQNDVVYVEPNAIKIDNSKYNQNNAFKLSVISTVVSAASVIASLVIALTVK